jgi:hypothetical protein
MTGNSVTVTSAAGNAQAGAGATIFAGTFTNGAISGNALHVTSAHGNAYVAGGGLLTGGAVTLRNTAVRGNTVEAHGTGGNASGGGIFAVDLSPDGPPGGPLLLSNSSVSGNAVSGSAGIVVHGGGLYVTNPLTRINSTISGNSPDNCFGSSC